MALGKTLLRVITLDRVRFEREVGMVVFDGQDGQIGILPGHAPMTVALHEHGLLKAHDGADEYVFYIAGGYAKVDADSVTVLTEASERPDEIDAERVKRELEAAENELHQTQDDAEFTRHSYDIRRAMVRLEVSSYPMVRSKQ